MRVVLVVPTFPKLSETFIVTKTVGLFQRGVDIHVLCGSSDPEQWSVFDESHPVHLIRDRVHLSPRLIARRREAIGRSARNVLDLHHAPAAVRQAQVAALLRSPVAGSRELALDADLIALDPDVVHFEFGAIAPARMALRDRLRAAVTVSFRGYDLNYVGLDQPDYYRPVWDRADGIHVLGQDLWERAVRRGAPADRPHTIINPAIDTVGIRPGRPRPGKLGAADHPIRILSIGRLHWKKGHEYALEAMASLRSRGVHVRYRIIGDGELLEAIAFWRHQLGLDDVVELVGAVRPAEVGEHLRWADVLVHAATSEGFGNAVIEAQAHGVPVVCSDADGLAENVEPDRTGFVVPRRRPELMAERVLHLARNPELRQTMGADGQSRVDQHFRLEPQLDAWQGFYSEAIARRSGP